MVVWICCEVFENYFKIWDVSPFKFGFCFIKWVKVI